MRDLIALLAIYLGEPARRSVRSAVLRASALLSPPGAPIPPPVIPPAPSYARQPLPDHVRERAQPLVAEDVALIRPYVVAHEHRAPQQQPALAPAQDHHAAAIAA